MDAVSKILLEVVSKCPSPGFPLNDADFSVRFDILAGCIIIHFDLPLDISSQVCLTCNFSVGGTSESSVSKFI